MTKDLQRNGLNIETGYTLESAGKFYNLGDILNAEIADSGADSAVDVPERNSESFLLS